MGNGWVLRDPYGFNYETFYDRLMEFFKDPDNRLVKHIMNWWNK